MAEAKDAGPYVVGYVTSPHPHAAMHIRTLDVLEAVEAIHLCGIEGEDLRAMAARSSKVVSTTRSTSWTSSRLLCSLPPKAAPCRLPKPRRLKEYSR